MNEEHPRWEQVFPVMPDHPAHKPSALAVQVGGGHYKDRAIQPIDYIAANKLNFCEGSIVKYITRWRDKGGFKDLEKIKHYVDLLIELEAKYGEVPKASS